MWFVCRRQEAILAYSRFFLRFAAANLDPKSGGPEFADIVDALVADDKGRSDFLKACLSKLGLQVAQDTSTIPSLSSLHVSGLYPEGPLEILSCLAKDLTQENKIEYLKDENDTFRIQRPGAWNLSDLEESLPGELSEHHEGIVDYQAIVKRLMIHDGLPSSKLTPYFNHHAFYSSLRQYQSESREGASEFGSNLLYGEVLTSTNTILEKYVVSFTSAIHSVNQCQKYEASSPTSIWIYSDSDCAGCRTGSRL